MWQMKKKKKKKGMWDKQFGLKQAECRKVHSGGRSSLIYEISFDSQDALSSHHLQEENNKH